MPRIKKIEVDDFADEPVKCPFCGKHAIVFDDYGQSYEVEPCPHLLFACYDDGWDYLSDRAVENLTDIGYEVNPDDDNEMVIPSDRLSEEEAHSPDHITDRITIPNAIKFASYQGAPSFYGAYAGFAPLSEDSTS